MCMERRGGLGSVRSNPALLLVPVSQGCAGDSLVGGQEVRRVLAR